MKIDLDYLSSKELRALIAAAESKIMEVRARQIQHTRVGIEIVLRQAGLTLDEVYPGHAGKKVGKRHQRVVVPPKYRNPQNPDETWTGRGRAPLWFATAIKRRGVTAESLLIAVNPKAPLKAVKKAPKKTTTRAVRKKALK